MGLPVDGIWRDQQPDRSKTGGRFIRPETQFRDRIEAGGRFAPELGRYHLYVSLACPWAHRTQIFRALKDLEPVISLSVVDPITSAQGWAFSDGPDCIPDSVGGAAYLHEIYTRAEPAYSGRVTVPVLWDAAENTIVNNESAEIIRLFNSAFDALTGNDQDYYPPALRAEIDAINEEIYTAVNNGVYRCGFATTAKRPTKKPSPPYSPASTAWRTACQANATSAARAKPKPTGACSRHCCASTQSTSATSNAI